MKPDGTLVILTPGFAAYEDDTTCLPMQQSLVKTMGELYPGINIIILSFQYPYCQKKYQWFNATVYSFNGKNKGGFSRLLLRIKIYNYLKEIHHSQKIIGLLSFWYGECAAVGKKFSVKHQLKHYCWLLGQDARKGNKHPTKIFLYPNELIALSDFIQAEFQKNYGIRPSHVIPPGINPKHQLPFNAKKDIDILAVGSLIPLKQYDMFVEIVAEIRKAIPGVSAVLIGEGSERGKLEKLIVQYSLKENLRLTGELSHGEVLQMMQRTKVFLHSSSYEGFGVVCLEALSAGSQVVSFIKPMNKQIKNWQIVKNKDEMMRKTIELFSDERLTYKSSLPFSMDNTAKQMMNLFVPDKI
jgi:glycosyltransferase involved in cell wall biosynthesis